jgi:hypothetical protein
MDGHDRNNRLVYISFPAFVVEFTALCDSNLLDLGSRGCFTPGIMIVIPPKLSENQNLPEITVIIFVINKLLKNAKWA